MATVVCNKPCKYRKAVFCGEDVIMLNQFGMCSVWFDRNGNMRRAPLYSTESEPQEEAKQEPPQQ